jgi:hypothetical protein
MCRSHPSTDLAQYAGLSRSSSKTATAKNTLRLVQLAPVSSGHASMAIVQVVLRKLGRGTRAVVGRLVRAPRKGSVVVIEFSDGMHEYVTTPVKRVLRLAGRDIFYIETINSRYRLEVRSRDLAFDGALSGS